MTQVIETDEEGRLVVPAELLGDAKPHTRYTVEATGQRLIVEPEQTPQQRQQVYEQWKREWDALTGEVSAAMPLNGRTAMEELTDMRNARGQGLILGREPEQECESEKC